MLRYKLTVVLPKPTRGKRGRDADERYDRNSWCHRTAILLALTAVQATKRQGSQQWESLGLRKNKHLCILTESKNLHCIKGLFSTRCRRHPTRVLPTSQHRTATWSRAVSACFWDVNPPLPVHRLQLELAACAQACRLIQRSWPRSHRRSRWPGLILCTTGYF